MFSIADELHAVKRTDLEVFSGGGKEAKNRANQPGTLPFAPHSTGLKTDPEAFRFCQIQRILSPVFIDNMVLLSFTGKMAEETAEPPPAISAIPFSRPFANRFSSP